jgi:hypothetical protein
MATQYEVDIMMSADTITQLKTNGFSLYGFKAVQTSNSGAAPTVWFQSQDFLQTTQVIWTEQYQAYVSTSQIIPNGVIDANTAIDINLAQTADTDADGNLTIAETGTPSAISIANQSSNPWTAGISEVVNGTANPMCAMPLFGNMLDVIAPIEKVLLTFASSTVNTGTVIYQSYSSGVLVDLTSAQLRSLTFDINSGWNWGGAGWGTGVAPQEDLVPILITSGSSAAMSFPAPSLPGSWRRNAALRAPAVRDHDIQLRQGASHVFADGTWPDGVELDNSHNANGQVRYRLGLNNVWNGWINVGVAPNAPPTIIPYPHHAQDVEVNNSALPASIDCRY